MFEDILLISWQVGRLVIEPTGAIRFHSLPELFGVVAAPSEQPKNVELNRSAAAPTAASVNREPNVTVQRPPARPVTVLDSECSKNAGVKFFRAITRFLANPIIPSPQPNAKRRAPIQDYMMSVFPYVPRRQPDEPPSHIGVKLLHTPLPQFYVIVAYRPSTPGPGLIGSAVSGADTCDACDTTHVISQATLLFPLPVPNSISAADSANSKEAESAIIRPSRPVALSEHVRLWFDPDGSKKFPYSVTTRRHCCEFDDLSDVELWSFFTTTWAVYSGQLTSILHSQSVALDSKSNAVGRDKPPPLELAVGAGRHALDALLFSIEPRKESHLQLSVCCTPTAWYNHKQLWLQSEADEAERIGTGTGSVSSGGTGTGTGTSTAAAAVSVSNQPSLDAITAIGVPVDVAAAVSAALSNSKLSERWRAVCMIAQRLVLPPMMLGGNPPAPPRTAQRADTASANRKTRGTEPIGFHERMYELAPVSASF